MKKYTRMYNVLFPVWMLILFPQMWLIVLPGNFLIDSLVLLLGMYVLMIAEKGAFYKQNILKIFLFGLLADVIGAAFMLLMLVLNISVMGDEWYFTVPAIIISAVCIFVLNYYVTFRTADKNLRFKLAMTFALATAPYTFLIPTSWLYY